MSISEKTKKTLGSILVLLVFAGAGVWMLLNPGPEHIADTNGPDNYALQQITEADVVDMQMGSRGGVSTSETHLNFENLSISSGIKYSCKKFTGVHRIYTATILKGSDIFISLSDYQVNSGNFAFYVVLDGEVIGQVDYNEFGIAEFLLEDIEKTGTVEYILAGESADFRFIAPTDW